jgi:hypothetical protein
VTVLAAAMGNETAGEQDEHGLFTRALLKGLKADKGVPFLNMPWTVPPLAIRQLPER